MRTNRELAFAVKRALATGTLALCGAGAMAAYAQPATATQTATTQATATAKTTTAKSNVTRKNRAKKSILLAQATAPQTTPLPSSNTAGPAPTQLQTVVVTGSLIARTSIETPNPVQVISNKDLQQSGYTDISTVLKNIPSNGASTLSQSFSFAFAAGASGISLRGLTVGDTLVLIDGERTVPYPLLDDNQRSFVDLASIPFTAIENIQVDKNGASAVYGSDAIAGVVNVILRKEFQGFKTSAEVGTSQRGDGTTEHLGFIGGHGDLEADGYNFYLSGDFRHQDQILASKRSGIWDSLDYTPWGGTFGGSTNIGASTAVNPVFAFPESNTGYLIDPGYGSTDTQAGQVVSYLPGCNAQQQALNKCLAIYPGSQLQPSTDRFDLLAKFTKKLNDNWTLGVQASWFESSSQEVAGYPTFAGGNPLAGQSNLVFGPGMAPAVVPASSLVTPNLITIPSTNPMYPTCTSEAWCGQPLAFQYDFPELGAASTQTNTNTYRLLGNLDGSVGGWDVHGTLGAMYAKMAYKLTGVPNWENLQTALNNGYTFGSSSGTSLFAPDMETTPWSELDLLDVHAQHELFDLPGGPVDFVIGAQWYKKTQDERAPAAAVEGLQAEGGGPIYVIGTEKDTAGFVEIDGKPIKSVEIDAAGRFDQVQGVGHDATPQIGVKFTPWKQIALRGTFGKGFRAPSAAEGGQSGELFGAGTYQDPVLCPNPVPAGMAAAVGDYSTQCAFFVTGFQASNPKLQPVKSTNWTLGVVLQPIEPVSASVDYYNIKVENDIVSSFEAGGLNNFTSSLRGAQILAPYCAPTATNITAGGCTTATEVQTLTPVGTILANSYPYVNSGFVHTSGFDVDLKAHFDAGMLGNLSAEATWTHLLTYQLLAYDAAVNGPVLFELAGTHGPAGISGDTGNPKDRASASVTWSKGALTVTPSMNFIGHFTNTDPSAGVTTCSAGLGYTAKFLGGATPENSQWCNVKYFLETNLYASYQVSGDFEVHASVDDLFNKTPPVDMMTYGSGTNFYPYDAALEQDGAVGRFFTIGMTYQFE